MEATGQDRAEPRLDCHVGSSVEMLKRLYQSYSQATPGSVVLMLWILTMEKMQHAYGPDDSAMTSSW